MNNSILTLRPDVVVTVLEDSAVLLDLQGRTIASTEDARMDTLHSEQPYFQEGLRAPCVHLFYSSSSGRLSAAVAQPLVDEEQTLGVLVGYTSADTLDEITREWTGMSETGKMYLVGSDHVLLTDSRLQAVFSI